MNPGERLFPKISSIGKNILKNPIIGDDASSGFPVFDGRQYRFYTMHPDVRVYFREQVRK